MKNTSEDSNSRESQTLDPADWSEMRALGHRMIDDMIDYVAGIGERPVWRPMPPEAKNFFRKDIPTEPQPIQKVYEDFKAHVLPYPVGNLHPRFFGWVQGNGTMMGAFAELLAATMNPNSWGGDQSAVYVERQIIKWMKELVEFPELASGVMVSGASVATLLALAIARKKYGSPHIRDRGMIGETGAMRIYCSVEAHNCVQRAADVLGIGRSNVVMIPTDAKRRIDVEKLKSAIQTDRKSGHKPIAVVGTAGTVGTGAIDDLEAISRVRDVEDLWFHVDGAIGAVGKCSKRLAPLLKGMETADSIAFDFHKWMFIPYEAGCVLVRDGRLHQETFSNPAAYLATMDGGVTPPSEHFFNDYGLELSRSMKGLKVWMSLKEHGLDRFAEIIEQNVDQAQHLAELIRNEPELELTGTGALNIVCFRFIGPDKTEEFLNGLNKKLLVAIQESGVAVPSPTVIDGKFSLRVCITNHRTKWSDLDLLIREVLSQGRKIMDRPLRQ